MKIIAKRSVSMLMALVLIVSLFSGVVVPASAATYTYNWGKRGEVATYLTPTAVNFYSGTSYETLSSYTGSSSVGSVPSSTLYKQLQSLMAGKQHTQTTYKGTRDLYKYTDCQNGGGRISSFYSGVEVGPAWDGGATWNREHTWPNSKGDESGNGENDIMMLRPASVSENSSRGNTAYGRSGGYYDPNRESGGKLNLHGDVARIMLYVYVRWGSTSRMWGSNGVIESKEVLLDWIEEDPVDTWELGRNDSVQSITGTRNVFVDYPELAFLMFNEEIPSDMVTPSGKAIAGAHKITVSSNNTAMGTVSLSGRNIQAYPAAGHKVVGYEVVSGSATVTQNGNTFEVKPSSDCEIRIIFTPKPVVTLTYLDNGIVMSSGQVFGGDPTALSAYTGTAPAGYSFLGWAAAPVNLTTAAPTHYKAGASYTVNSETKLYALFSHTVAGTNGSSTFYTTTPCTHRNTMNMAAQAATCTNGGYTAGVYCKDCGNYISGHESIGALGHSYNSVVTEPTVTEPGYTTNTCGRCGDVYTSDPVPALGETYTVFFSVPADADPIEAMGCNTKGIILPESEALEGYTFLGWTTASLEDTTDAPVYYEAGEKYVTAENTTLYALYTYVVGGSTEGGYVLVTDVSQLKSGSEVIIASASSNVALSTKQNNNNRGQAVITKSGEKIIFGASSGVAVLTLCDGTVAGTYAFYCPTNGGYLCAASSSSNYLRTQSALDANGSFLITVNASGVATATAKGSFTRNQLKYNSSSSIFGCYSSGQQAISLYVEAPAGTAHYLTNIAHRHSGTYRAAVAPTCTSAGNVAYYSCVCGMNFSDSGCTKVLSSIVDPKLDHSFTVQTVDAKYLKTEANCQSGAVYYLNCASCGTSSNSDNAVFVSGSTNPQNHPGAGIFAGETPATCTTAGNTGNTLCGDCGEVMAYGTEIPATGHADAIAVDETASTCTTYGVKFHYHCDACGGDYLEKTVDAAAQTAEDLQLPLNPDNHEGETELRNKSDATCEADGYTGDTHCIACGEKLEEGKPIPGGHTVENGICTRCEVYGTCGENLTWTLSEDGVLTVRGTGAMDNYSARSPWIDCEPAVKTVIIENGVTAIGASAFYDLDDLADITIPDSVTEIGSYAFFNCDKLTTVEIPKSVTRIETDTFYTCTGLTEIVIPDSVTTIGLAAFFGCTELTEIVIPESVTAIEGYAFFGCDALKEITFEGSAPAIGNEAFGLVTANVHYTPDASWTADVKQNYGGTITWVAQGSGTCGENLIWTYENGTLTISGEGEMYDYSTEANPENAPWINYLEEVKSIVIEEGVTSVGHQAFSGLFAVTEVSLPDTLTTIGGSAFFNCVALKEIVIPANVTSIGDSAFTFCYALTEITFEGSAPAIGNEAFGLVTANVHYTPDASWTADVKQNYGGTLSWDSYVTGAASVNGVEYETFTEALAAAGKGDKVQLLQDAAAEEIRVSAGVALDLNGHTLTAEYVFAVNGSQIVDSSEDNSGLLKVASDKIQVSKTNSQLPVATGEGFIFVNVLKFQEMYTGNAMGQKQYIFSPAFESVAHPYLAQGRDRSGVSIVICMTWQTGAGSGSRNFVYNDQTVKTIMESFAGNRYDQAFYVTVNNGGSVDFNIQVSLISDTGVELACN